MATAVFVQKGSNIDFIAPSNKGYGYMEIVPLISRIGVALEPIEKNGTGSVSLTGIYELPAATSLAIAVGDIVYLNTTNNNIDKTSENGVLAGMAVSTKASAGTTVKVRIG